MIRSLAKLWWKISGWTLKGQFPFEVKKMVIAVGPHTSAWDVVVGMAAREAIPIKNGYFLGKKELFDGPFGWFFRIMGGTPVDRFSKQGMVEQVVEKFRQNEIFRLALSPEGTRKKVDKLRSGFYHIAKGAGVPILLVGLDFSKKEVVFSDLLFPSDNEQEDLKKMVAFFSTIQGKRPELGLQHLKEIY
jgi:1-acyl-sn-glycerol-3-phosphate acyltransferase